MKKLAFLLCFVAGVALAQTGARTPQVNDVLTYFGPTIGSDWGPPPSGPIIPDNVTLKTYAVSQATYLIRQSFSSTVYAPPITYIASGSPCPLNAGNGDDGSQVRSADGKCWLAKFPAGKPDARQWGVVVDSGVTDNTAAINACLAYASTQQLECLLPATPGNTYIKTSSTITVPAGLSVDPYFGNRGGLRGQGQNETQIVSTVTGTTCAINYSMTFGLNGEGYTGGDFQLRNNGFVGYGLCLHGISAAIFNNIFIYGFTIGIDAVDAIRIRLDNPSFVANNISLKAQIGTSSQPGQWVIINPKVSFSTNDSFLFVNGADIDIYGGDFENNNTANNTGHCTINMSGAPMTGRKGLSVFGGYYSGNGGSADFCILQNVAENGAAHQIYGTETDRNGATTFTTNSVLLTNNGTNITYVDIRGNAFSSFNAYVQSGARLDIAVSTPATKNYVITGYESNYFMPGADAPPTTFIPTDGSGATLTFTTISTNFNTVGPRVFVEFNLTYPVTGSAAVAQVNGLPFVSANQGYGGTTGTCLNGNTQVAPHIMQNTSVIQFYGAAGPLANSSFSGRLLRCSFNYPIM